MAQGQVPASGAGGQDTHESEAPVRLAAALGGLDSGLGVMGERATPPIRMHQTMEAPDHRPRGRAMSQLAPHAQQIGVGAVHITRGVGPRGLLEQMLAG